jgi:hypothetical protein
VEIDEDGAYVPCELPHFLGYTANAFGFDKADGESAEPGHVVRAISCAYAAAIFVKIPVDDIMAAVFYAPVTAIGFENAFWVGLVRAMACDAISDFTGVFAGLFVCCLPLDHKRLSHMREVEIVVELGCCPYFSDLYAAMIRGIALNKMRIFCILEMKCDILEETGLVVFDGEVIMGVTILNQIACDLALGQEGVCGNGFAFDIDSVKEWDSSLDFVGAFEFIGALYGERADFFWA